MIETEAALPAALTEERWSWPPLFCLLEVPFGAAGGFLQIAVPYWLSKEGMPLAEIGLLSATAFSPHAWKLLWVPLIDLGPWRRVWYGVSTLLTALLLVACALLPEPSKNLVLYMATLVLASGASIFWIPEPPGEKTEGAPSVLHAAWERVKGILVDLFRTAISRDGFVMLLLCLMPISCGALNNLFSAMAGDYHAGEGVVTTVNGLGMGLSGALGSLLGGWLSDRINRKLNYALIGVASGLSALVMVAAPMTEKTYIWGALVYSFVNGAGFAAFAGMVLELVRSGAAVTTKYTLFVSTSNFAISYVTFLDGQALNLVFSVFAKVSGLELIVQGLGTGAYIALDGLMTLAGIAGLDARASIAFDGLIAFAGIAGMGLLFLLFLRKKPQPVAA